MSRTGKIIALLAIAVAAYGAYRHFVPKGGWGQQGGAAPVGVAEVIERDVRLWHEFSGHLIAVDTVELRPQISGTIDHVYFKDGAMVHKGEVLFTIDQRPFKAALEAAQAAYAYAESEYRRSLVLFKDKAIPRSEADQRYNAYQQAKANLTRAQVNMDYTTIASPIDGRASRAEITEGNLVESGQNAPVLTTVVSSTPLYADFEIDENTFMQYARAGVTDNQHAGSIPVQMGLAGDEGTSHEGHVQSFDNRLSQTSGTVRVRAVFDNKDGVLVPGLFARIRMGSAAPEHALLITDRAIGTDQDKKFVLVVGADNKAEHREITLGPRAEGLRIVTAGLKPGEKIIVSGMQRVMMPGQPVKPEPAPMQETVISSQGGNHVIETDGEKSAAPENKP